MLKQQAESSILEILEKKLDGIKTRRKNTKSTFTWLAFLTLIGGVSIVKTFYINSKIETIERNETDQRQALSKIRYDTLIHTRTLGGLPIPLHLTNVPDYLKNETILGIKTIAIRGVKYLYNPTLIPLKGRYLFFFRYDVPSPKAHPAPFLTYIGIAELDKDFQQTEKEFQILDVKSDFAEDPRAVIVGKELFIFYNDRQKHDPNCRAMHLANVDINTLKVKYTTKFDRHFQHIEKNWAPFEYVDANGHASLYIEYYLSPHTVFKIPDPKINHLEPVIVPNHVEFNSTMPWRSDLWGCPRGGTNALKIDGQYLAFFHSAFKYENTITWYLMGAYTFDPVPPFHITSFSHHPILFDGIYETSAGANPNIRCIFPCGMIQEERQGKSLLHVACGENDAAVKILTFDLEKLKESLRVNRGAGR